MNDETKMRDEKDKFPVGLRVLSVDDNLTCLRVLEAKLIQCKYNVTSTTSAIEALNILRQNKNNFDIIVTDVHMPDMDGFKLLEHVGLEMDLPCIMLSANDDPKTVMKGIEHGACDYLLKPVRIEELKNIWQHVIRKKKSCKEHNNSDNTTSDDGNSNRKPHIKKRKEHDDEEEEDEETIADNESMSKKKPRVVWTQELHHKFMDAIKVLGVNKAVPKKILEIMNVEGLSRENVASHLQKYRLYIKKLEEKANMMATMGLRDQFLNPAARDSYRDFQAFSSSSNNIQTLQPYQQNSAFSRSNSGMLLGNNNVAHGLVQVPRPLHMNNPIGGHGNRFHQGNNFQQMPLASQKRLLIHENNSFDGFQTSTYQTHVNSNSSMPLNSNMIHSAGAPNSLPMSSMLSPKVTQANPNMNSNMSHLNFTSSNSSVSHPNISANNNNLAVDPMLMLNATNDGSNFLNFGNTSQSQNRNITFGPQFGGQPLTDPNSSHSQRLQVGTVKASMNANGHQDYNNSMPLAQQQCKFEKSIPDNLFKNDIFLDNSLLQGDLDSSGCIFNELENLIQPDQAFGSTWPSDLKTDPFN